MIDFLRSPCKYVKAFEECAVQTHATAVKVHSSSDVNEKNLKSILFMP
jgi:hypothetical protein